jgi:hypothetical protein
MAKAESCYHCAYSHWDRHQAMWSLSMGVATRPACANHPESFGRMRPVPVGGGVCANYRSRPGTPEGEVKQIPLGNGFYAYVDAADYEWLSQWTWSLRGGYAVRIEKRKPIFMHRQIMQPPKGMIVDHKNLNKLDNTRANLRNCTHQENACNRSKKRGTLSRFRGVGYSKHCAKYFADIYYKGERFFCGYFRDEIEAARARDRKAVEVLGESARLNFPEEWPAERRAEVHAQRDGVRREGKKVRRKQAKTGGRLRPRGTGHKARATSARPRATGDVGRDRTRVRRQKAKSRNGGPDARCATRDAGRSGAKARAQKGKGKK